MRTAPAALVTIAACGLPLLTACGPAADGAASAEASASAALSSASAAMSSSAAAAVSSAQAAASSASAALQAASAPAVPTTATSSQATTRTVSFRMPNLVGQVLQDAQNALHAEGVFYSRSHDLRGVRHQVLDRDWKVCSQNLPAGQQVSGTVEGTIDFGVVKLSETCP